MARMVVKALLFGGEMVVHDEKRTHTLRLAVTNNLRIKMGASRERYFHADLVPGAVDFISAAPKQGW